MRTRFDAFFFVNCTIFGKYRAVWDTTEGGIQTKRASHDWISDFFHLVFTISFVGRVDPAGFDHSRDAKGGAGGQATVPQPHGGPAAVVA